MKFLEIFRYELVSRTRSASTWVYLVVLLGLSVLMVDGLLVQEARGSGNTGNNYNVNAPFMLAFTMVFFSMIGMAVTAGLFSDAAVRDYQSRMHPLFFTSPISKVDYLGGRFLGAFVVNALLLTVLPLGLILGLQLQDLEPGMLGPFRLEAFIQPFFVILLPNMFITASILTAIAVLSRRALASYVGGLILFLGSMITAEELVEQSAFREVAALMEPFGFLAVRELITYWTPFERNTQLIAFDGVLLWNRLLWMAMACCVLAFLYLRFRFGHEAERERKNVKPVPSEVRVVADLTSPLVVPHAAQFYTFQARMRQMLSVVSRSFSEIFASRFLVFIALASMAFIFIAGWDAWIMFDTPTWPITYVVAREVLGVLPPLIYVLLAIFAGELVWREREAGMGEITDSMPLPNWVPLIGKFIALVLALVALQAVLMAGGMLLQTFQGYYKYEPGLYVQILFGVQLVDYVQWAALAMLVHVLVNHKYIGHLVFVLYYIFFAFGRRLLDLEHNLLVYPAAPTWNYSDISGFEPFLAPYLWFKLYWGAWALLLAVVANLFWKRGRESGLRHRLTEVKMRFSRPARFIAAGVGLFILAAGGFVFYNTNILNEYLPKEEQLARLGEYERLYKQYADTPQPRVTGSSYQVEIYPEKPAISLKGVYLLQNLTATPIDSIHLMIDQNIEVKTINIDREAARVLDDKKHGYHIVALAKALAPGDSLRLSFELDFKSQGFTNYGATAVLVRNGTFIDYDRMPVLGYQPGREIKSSALRRKQGLAVRKPTPSVYDEEARCTSPRFAEWIHSEAVIGTALDQVAVAPGSLQRSWTENGRRYFHYKTDVPVKNVYAFFSAEYEVFEDQWQGVQVQILHHPAHAFNRNSMVRSIKASLDYFTAHFGPYRYPQIRIVEFPRHEGNFARAFPGTVAYSESMGFMARVEDGIDYPFVVTAHEVAHQWWGGQFAAAEVQGKSVLHESLAHYSALMVMEKTYGPEKVRRFLEHFLHRYLVGRQNRGHLEVPLLLSVDQDYIHYDKGAVVMYALRNYIGEEQINLALRRFLDKYRYSKTAYPTTLDLLAELRAVTPDSLQYLHTDLFEEITVWDMRTKLVQVQPTGTGKYLVTLEVEGTKMKADSIGRAQRVPMDDFVEIGLFAAAKDGEELGQPIYLKKHRIRSGDQSITVTVPQIPERAGIDPYHRLIEWTRDDNVIEAATGNR